MWAIRVKLCLCSAILTVPGNLYGEIKNGRICLRAESILNDGVGGVTAAARYPVDSPSSRRRSNAGFTWGWEDRMSRLASRLPAWPFVILVLAVAVLSLIAPYGWRQRVRDDVDAPAAEAPESDYRVARRNVPSDPSVESHLIQPRVAVNQDLLSPRIARDEAVASQIETSADEIDIPQFVSTEEPRNIRGSLQADRDASEYSVIGNDATAESLVREQSPPLAQSSPQNAPLVELGPDNFAENQTSPGETGRIAIRSKPENALRPRPEPRVEEAAADATSAASSPRSSNSSPMMIQGERRDATVSNSMRSPVRIRISDSPTEPSGSASASEDVENQVSAWPSPVTLLDGLEELGQAGIAVEWTTAVKRELQRLGRIRRLDDHASSDALARLRGLADIAPQAAEQLAELPSRSQLIRCSYSLSRRVAVWTAVHELAVSGLASDAWTLQATQETAVARAAVDAYLSSTQNGSSWKQYLCVEAARSFEASLDQPTLEQLTLARQILSRLDASSLGDSQAEFLKKPVFANWAATLRQYARERVQLSDLLTLVEQYERTFSQGDSQGLARGFQTLRWSPLEIENRLAQPLNDHYRNANVRVAIAASLINRVLPSEHSTVEAVDDVIRDAHVQGQSQVSSRIRVFLVPDRWQWRLGLEARGDVAAQTESRKGPATFYQDAYSNYDARKHVTVDKRGVRLERAEARARSSSDLRGFETDYDGIPLFNMLARSIANRKYQEESARAESEVEEKVAMLARQRLDEEVQKRLSDAEGEFQQKWLSPLRKLGLDPTPVDFETTEQRLIVRYRLAGTQQLAAHTPRPQAPANSWLSVQLHESAFNNTFDQLRLGGRKVSIDELYRELAVKFDRPAPTIPDDLPEDVTITFAPIEGIRVRCDHGQVHLTLRIAELAQGRGNRWRNFEVRATYVPSTDQREANLVRDGIIELGGERRGLGNQVALRAIFAKVLSKNRPIRLINHSMARQPQLNDLDVNQFVIHDGWIGVAMAPKINTARIPYRQHRRF